MPQKVSTKRRAQARKPNNAPVILGVGVIAVVAVGLLVLLNMNLETRPPAPNITAGGKLLGKADAKIAIDEYADFQ